MTTIRARFAPSPTGNLHLGTLRTALFTWLFARNKGGTTILRIEDTDLNRSNPEFEKSIQEGLDWLGLDCDESPVQGGQYGPYRQSERIQAGRYQAVSEVLVKNGKAYPCFCSKVDLDLEREVATSAEKPYVYSGKCSHLSSEEVDQKKSADIPYTLRFKLPKTGSVVIKDIIRGEVSFEWNLLSDFVIMKSDGSPSYNFACVVDDADMEITHVIRGEDHISNTPRQMAVYEGLGKNIPEFAHLPMILGADKSKLSKRHGATNVIDYQTQGFLPEALFNYMTLLGWSPTNEQEIFSRDEIVSQFSLERVSKSGAVFDLTKLTWMNAQYIKALPIDEFQSRVSVFIEKENKDVFESQFDQETQKLILELLQDGVELLPQINQSLQMFVQSETDYKNAINECEFSERDRGVISQFAQLTRDANQWSVEQVVSQFDTIFEETGLGKGAVFKPLRKASTGAVSGPDIAKVLTYLGREKLITRLSDLEVE